YHPRRTSRRPRSSTAGRQSHGRESAMSRLSVVIPVYNEAATVAALVEAALLAPLPEGVDREVILVDDGSTDGTPGELARFAADPRVRTFSQDVNRGKGAALRRGF